MARISPPWIAVGGLGFRICVDLRHLRLRSWWLGIPLSVENFEKLKADMLKGPFCFQRFSFQRFSVCLLGRARWTEERETQAMG